MGNPFVPAALGAMVMAIIFVMLHLRGLTPSVEGSQAKAAIAKCQSTLPRNQTCKYVITAVPEVKE